MVGNIGALYPYVRQYLICFHFIVSFLPEKLRDLVQNREHFRVGRRMVRTSPENDAGLSNVMHPSGCVKKCTFSDNIQGWM